MCFVHFVSSTGITPSHGACWFGIGTGLDLREYLDRPFATHELPGKGWEKDGKTKIVGFCDTPIVILRWNEHWCWDLE